MPNPMWGPLTREAYILRRRLWRRWHQRRDDRIPKIWAMAWNRFSRRLVAGR